MHRADRSVKVKGQDAGEVGIAPICEDGQADFAHCAAEGQVVGALDRVVLFDQRKLLAVLGDGRQAKGLA